MGKVRMTAAGIKVEEGSKSQIIIGLGGYGREFGFYFPWARSRWRILSRAVIDDLHF